MIDDDAFEPHLGRQKVRGAKRARTYLSRLLAAANLARGGAPSPLRPARFSGTRIGRGAGVGRMLASRGGHAASNGRRVIVKASIVKLAGKGAFAAAAHLRYLQRDGTAREGERGTPYGRDADTVDAKAFGERGAGDRHQFRFIVSPEDGDQYDDLKPLTRRLMDRMEEDLGTKLDWVAVDHFNTGHPHTHIVVRGKDDRGADLVIARDYMTTGIRERAAELVDLDLGPRTHREIAQALRAEVEQERLTSIDRALLKGADAERVVATSGRDGFDQTLRADRLAKLSRLGLAEPMGAGRFRLAPDLADMPRSSSTRQACSPAPAASSAARRRSSVRYGGRASRATSPPMVQRAGQAPARSSASACTATPGSCSARSLAAISAMTAPSTSWRSRRHGAARAWALSSRLCCPGPARLSCTISRVRTVHRPGWRARFSHCLLFNPTDAPIVHRSD